MGNLFLGLRSLFHMVEVKYDTLLEILIRESSKMDTHMVKAKDATKTKRRSKVGLRAGEQMVYASFEKSTTTFMKERWLMIFNMDLVMKSYLMVLFIKACLLLEKKAQTAS